MSTTLPVAEETLEWTAYAAGDVGGIGDKTPDDESGGNPATGCTGIAAKYCCGSINPAGLMI